MTSYRDFIPAHHRQPLRIERTMKRCGDVVIGNASRPARILPGIKGRYAGKVMA